MATMKYEIPLLDHSTKFSLLQVKMRVVLAQMDLDCHTPDPGPTRLANPNRFRGTKPYTGTPHYFILFYFFSELTLSVVYK